MPEQTGEKWEKSAEWGRAREKKGTVRHRIIVDSFWAVYSNEQITTNCETFHYVLLANEWANERVYLWAEINCAMHKNVHILTRN